MAPSDTVRRRLVVQGFAAADPALEPLIGWLRLSPAICTSVMAVGTALASPLILLGLVPFAALGSVLSVHPFDLLYNHGLRHLTGTGPLPPNGAPRRFGCAVATVWLLVAAGAFLQGWLIAGYILGTILTGVAAVLTTTHFCLPSTIYQRLFARRAVARG